MNCDAPDFLPHIFLPAPSEGRYMMGEIRIVGREPMAASRFPFSGRVQETAFGCNHLMPRQLSELKNAQPLTDAGVRHTNPPRRTSLPRGSAITNEPQSSKGLPLLLRLAGARRLRSQRSLSHSNGRSWQLRVASIILPQCELVHLSWSTFSACSKSLGIGTLKTCPTKFDHRLSPFGRGN